MNELIKEMVENATGRFATSVRRTFLFGPDFLQSIRYKNSVFYGTVEFSQVTLPLTNPLIGFYLGGKLVRLIDDTDNLRLYPCLFDTLKYSVSNASVNWYNAPLTVLHNNITSGTLAVPALTGINPLDGGGSLAAGTYAYQLTAINAAGETTPSNQQNSTLLGVGANRLFVGQVTGATAYRLYRSIGGGAFNQYTQFSPSNSIIDDGSLVWVAATLPLTNTTGTATYQVETVVNFNVIPSTVAVPVDVKVQIINTANGAVLVERIRNFVDNAVIVLDHNFFGYLDNSVPDNQLGVKAFYRDPLTGLFNASYFTDNYLDVNTVMAFDGYQIGLR